MIDLLVISHACFMAINRNVYHLFVKDGWNVEIVAPAALNFPAGQKKAEPKRPEDPPIHFLSLNGDNPRTYLFEGLDAILDEKKPRFILLDNDPVSRLALSVGKWSKENEAKLFCISCENLPLDLVSTIRRRGIKNLPAAMVKRLMLSKTRKVVDGVFTINSDGKKIFINEGYKLVERMPLGFDPVLFHPDKSGGDAIRTKLGLNKKTIAYFGRLTREKGVHILIKALEGLKDQDWILMMDDFDEYASDYNKEIHQLLHGAGIMDRVKFISPSHYEIAAYMNAADIVVVPSISAPHWKEQYGRVAAEAMACGTKVIASDSGALPELLSNHGWLFPEGNVTALTDLIRSLLNDKADTTGRDTASIAGYASKELSLVRQKDVMQALFKKTTGIEVARTKA